MSASGAASGSWSLDIAEGAEPRRQNSDQIVRPQSRFAEQAEGHASDRLWPFRDVRDVTIQIRISDTACQFISERLHERPPRMLQVIPHPLIQSALGQTASTFIPSDLALSIIASSRQSTPCAAVAR